MLPRLFIASVASLISVPARYPWTIRSSLPILSCVQTRTYPSSSTRRFLSQKNVVQSPTSELVDQINQAYSKDETDGILSMMKDDPDILLGTPPILLIRASIEATRGFPKPRAAAAGVLNAIVGTCVLLQEEEDAKRQQGAAKAARSIWNTMEELLTEKNEEDAVAPDTVTYCLIYCATLQHDPTFASSVLERARHASKKQAGSKRRKALAAARRRSGIHHQDGAEENSTATQRLETSLQQILGDESLRVLYDTDDVLVVSKPSGVVCYHSAVTTSGKISRRSKSNTSTNDRDISLEDALLHANVPLSTLNPDCLGLVHRIDRGTSGCMIWSKSDEMHAKLVTSFFIRKVHKQYTALVSPAPTGIRNEPGASIHLDGDVQGHAARSKVTVLESFGNAEHATAAGSPVAALLQVEPTTGRRHQVRVHCAQGLNALVVMDPLYSYTSSTSSFTSNPDVLSFLPETLQRQALSSASSTSSTQKTKKSRKKEQHQTRKVSQQFFLHASSLSIPNLNIDLKCSTLPKWWEETLRSLREL